MVEKTQLWEGTVISVGIEEFHASLVDVDSIFPEMNATFPLSVLNRDEKLQLRSGTIFRWEVTSDSSRFYFDPFPSWTEDEVSRVETRASEMYKALEKLEGAD